MESMLFNRHGVNGVIGLVRVADENLEGLNGGLSKSMLFHLPFFSSTNVAEPTLRTLLTLSNTSPFSHESDDVYRSTLSFRDDLGKYEIFLRSKLGVAMRGASGESLFDPSLLDRVARLLEKSSMQGKILLTTLSRRDGS
jgi:hypothetical protein